MTTFVLASLALAAIALAILTRPYWRPEAAAKPVPMSDPKPVPDALAALRQKIRELDALRDSGELGAEAHASARAALEKQLVDLVVAGPAVAPAAAVARTAPAAAAPRKSPVKTLAMLGTAFAAVCIGGYLWLGDPRALGDGPTSVAANAGNAGSAGNAGNPAAGDPASHELSKEQIAAMAERLAARLEKQPDDPEGWAMLARSYAVSGQHAKAVPAFRKAASLTKDDPVLLADFADALAMTQDRTLAGEPMALVKKALELDPNNIKALSLAGTEAFNRNDYPGALKHWEKLRSIAPPDSVFVQQLQGGIDEARARSGLPPVAAAAPAPAPTPATTGAAPATMATAMGKSVSGVVTLSAGLAAKAAPTDTVFVFARAVDGPRMPLAIARHQVKDLPIKFTLDDSSAMTPATRISSFPQVVVGARISKDGQAMPQPGDLQGLTAAVALGSADVKVEINQTVSK